MVWNPAVPTPDSLLSEFPSMMTAQAIAFRQGIERASYWTDSSGASAGLARPGACRAFFDVASNLSSSLSTTKPLAGRLYVTSDTSRLYGYSSNATTLLGGQNILTYWGDSFTLSSDRYFLVQIGSSGITLASRNTIPLPLTYNGSAADVGIQLQPLSSGTTTLWNAALLSSGTTNFVVQGRFLWGSASTVTLLWRTCGVATL